MQPAFFRASLLSCLGAALLLGGLPVLAQEETSSAYVSAMTAPLERVEASAEELGIALPMFLRREVIEDKLPFLGAGSLRGDGSVGVWISPSLPSAREPIYTFFWPVTQDAVPLRLFTDRGAQRLSPTSDTVERQGTFFRRVKGFLLAGPSNEDITAADPQAAAMRLSAPGVLAELIVDLERWRTTDPDIFREMMSDQEPPADGEQAPVEAFGKVLREPYLWRRVDRLHLTLLDAAPVPVLRLQAALEPLAPGAITPFPKPAFPSASLGRVDIVYASSETSQWVLGALDEHMADMERDNQFAEAIRAGINPSDVQAVLREIHRVLWVADAISLALEPSGGKVLYHQVNQYRRPAHFTARLHTLLKRYKALERKARENSPFFRSTTYKVNGTRITRVALPNNLTLDFADSGTTVRLVIAQDSRRHLPALLNAPASGSVSSTFSGRVEPGALLAAFPSLRSKLPPTLALAATLDDDLRGQVISWETRPEGTAAVVDFQVPKLLIHSFFQSRSGAEPSRPPVKVYEQVCEAGDPQGCYLLGGLHAQGRGVPADERRAAALFQKACDGGQAAGCSALGRHYEQGRGVSLDMVHAAALYETACNAGDGPGCGRLGRLHRGGLGVAQDDSRANALFEKACARGLAAECGALGDAYGEGRGVPQDKRRATMFFEKACEGGHEPGCEKLAVSYVNGWGGSKDGGRVATLVEKACDQGKVKSCLALGTIYEKGLGVPSDSSRAAVLFEMACERGEAAGCQALGALYETGRGVPKDMQRARELLSPGCQEDPECRRPK